MRKWALLGLVAAVFWVGTALGDSMVRPTSYRSVIGPYIFVMLAPGAEPVRTADGVTYPQSGLYKNDGSTTPLWTVNWWAGSGNVMLSADGHHLARLEAGQEKGDFQALAVAFYTDGTVYKVHRVSDLVQHPERMRESVSHFQWLRTSSYEPAEEQLRLTTEEGRSYSFDIRTGALLQGQLPSADAPPTDGQLPARGAPAQPTSTYVELAVLFCLALAGGWWWRRRHRG